MYLQIKDLNIYFQKTGKGKVLIMLHGWGLDVSTFWGVVELLKDKYTIYLIDLPGFGRSSLPKNAYAVSDYAEIIKEFISKEKLEKPIILGHSFGGRIAIKLTSKYPELVDKLILEDAAGIKPRRDLLKPVFYIGSGIFKYLMPNIFNLKERIRYKFYSSLESDYLNAGVLKDTLTNILAEDLTPDLKKIDTETLLIWGEKDATGEASLENGKKMYRFIKNSRIEIIDDAGHSPHLDKPERFAYYVKDFS